MRLTRRGLVSLLPLPWLTTPGIDKDEMEICDSLRKMADKLPRLRRIVHDRFATRWQSKYIFATRGDECVFDFRFWDRKTPIDGDQINRVMGYDVFPRRRWPRWAETT